MAREEALPRLPSGRSAELAFVEVVGWCDILPTLGEARRHVGVLGIGVIPGARHHGLGRRLTEAAIAKAWAKGMTRIELTFVRTT